MDRILTLLCYGFVLLYGIGLSLSFSGVNFDKVNRLKAIGVSIFLMATQIAFGAIFKFDITLCLYPLIIHLPLFLFLVFLFKIPTDVAGASVFSSYFCCQIPRWIASLAEWLFHSHLSYYIFYIISIFFVYYLFIRFVTKPVNNLITQSHRACLLFGFVPFFYYLFDYTTTVYTDLLYSGTKFAVQFMPSIVSRSYFIFVLLYYSESKKQAIASQERDLATAQLRQAESEISSFRQLQADSAAYRHDMRHHFTLLQGMASTGQLDAIQNYLKIAQANLDEITPIRWCANETVNLILSVYMSRAKHVGVDFKIDINVPKSLPLSDTELCSLLSNGLENALHAASQNNLEKATMTVMATVHKNNLLLSITNPYSNTLHFENGLPKSEQEGHGFGVQSICRIVNLHNGTVSFSAQDGIFTLRVLLPMSESDAI